MTSKDFYDFIKRIQRDPFFVIPLTTLVMALAIAVQLQKNSVTKLTDDPKLLVMTVGMFSTLLMVAFVGLLRYLRSEDSEARPRNEDRLDVIEHVVRTILQDLAEKKAALSDEERNALKAALMAEIAREGSKQVYQELEKRLKAQSPEVLLTTVIEERYQQSVARLMKEVQALGKRSNLNLVIGIFTAVTGLVVLACVIFAVTNPSVVTTSNLKSPDAITDLLRAFVPRLSLVLLIEVFAYFFLRLYKSNLGEIKYFQNELTNLEVKFAATRLALATDDKVVRAKVIDELCRTERNFVLKKDETTVQLQQIIQDKQSAVDLAKAISEMIEKVKK